MLALFRAAMLAILRVIGLIACVVIAGASGALITIAAAGISTPACGLCSWIVRQLGVVPNSNVEANSGLSSHRCVGKDEFDSIIDFTRAVGKPADPNFQLWTNMVKDVGTDCIPAAAVLFRVCTDIKGGWSGPTACAVLKH
jgi:hypothetical protein